MTDKFHFMTDKFHFMTEPTTALKHLIDLDDIVGAPNQVTFHYMSRDYGYDAAGKLVRVDATDNPTVSSGGIVPAPFVDIPRLSSYCVALEQ